MLPQASHSALRCLRSKPSRSGFRTPCPCSPPGHRGERARRQRRLVSLSSYHGYLPLCRQSKRSPLIPPYPHFSGHGHRLDCPPCLQPAPGSDIFRYDFGRRKMGLRRGSRSRLSHASGQNQGTTDPSKFLMHSYSSGRSAPELSKIEHSSRTANTNRRACPP